MSRLSRLVFLVLASTTLVPSSEATVLLSNFSEPFLTDGDAPLSLEQWAGQSFITDATSHVLDWIDVIVGNRTETPTVVAELRTDDGSARARS